MQVYELRGADGTLYHTTTSAAARLGVSYADAKALIASGRIPSVSAESVGVRVNKPGARLVSEGALEAYQRGAVGGTMIEPQSPAVDAGRTPVAATMHSVSVPAPPPRSGSGSFRTATMIIGLVMGVILLFGGMAGSFVGTIFEFEANESGGSSSDEVQAAGALAVLVAFILIIGAGLAKTALKTSTALMILAFLGNLLVLAVDQQSWVALIYWPAVLVTGVCSVLMVIAVSREGRGASVG